MKERNHFYLYTVDVRRVEKDADGNKITHWDEVQIADCCNLHDVAGKLQKPLDDIRYKDKRIISQPATRKPGETPAPPPVPVVVEHLATGEIQVLIPDAPPRTIPDAPLRPKKNQKTGLLPLERPAVEENQRRLF